MNARGRSSIAGGRVLGSETFPALEGILIECPVWMSEDLRSISVRLLSGSGESEDRPLAELRLEARAKSFPGHIVLACGLSMEARLALASSLMPLEPVLVVATSIAELPSNGLDYDAVSAIAIAGRSLEPSPAQRGAILAWMSGGGRLCLADAAERWALPASVAGKSMPYGLGSFASLPPDRAEVPASWIRALSLSPYESSQRAGAGSSGRGPVTTAEPVGPSSEAGKFIRAAIAAWLAATLLGAAIGRKRLAPLAAVSALGLASVLAGGGALDRALVRGASVRALALVLPGSGSAFLSLRAKAYVPPSSVDWAAARAIGAPSVSYSNLESGTFGEWEHAVPKAAFGLRGADSGGLELEAMVAPDEWMDIAAGSTGAFSRESRLQGGDGPPDVESSFPLAFLSEGAIPAWWNKDPGARWAKSEGPPAWLEGDAQWLTALRGGLGALSVLAGSCRADSLSVRAEGGALREIRWAMPLPRGGGR